MKESVLPSPASLDGPGLAARLRPALVRFFKRKTGSAVEAEDLTQDVLVSALAHADWKTPEQARGYIFRAAINRLRDRRRRVLVRGVTVDWSEEFQHVGSENPIERVLIVQEELSEIDRTLEELDVRTRTVLVLIKLEHMKATEVAQMLGISVRAVNKHVQKAIARLAKACAGEER